MALPDNEFDALIKSTLQQGTNVPPFQKQIAWEKLNEKLREQAILPATLTAEEMTYAARFLTNWSVFWRQLSTFATHEDRYERARLQRSMLKYNGFNQSGEIVFQFLEPVRMTI